MALPPRFQPVPREPRLPHPQGRSGDRFLLSDAIEHRCQLIDVSGSGAALRTAVRGEIGERVICYLDQYGRVTGRVARHLEDGFAILFETGPAKRERIAQEVAWATGRPAPARETPPTPAQIIPDQRRVVMRVPSGARVAAQIVALTCAGATLTMPAPPPIGAAVLVGSRTARVARTVQRLVVVVFDTPIATGLLRPDIML